MDPSLLIMCKEQSPNTVIICSDYRASISITIGNPLIIHHPAEIIFNIHTILISGRQMAQITHFTKTPDGS